MSGLESIGTELCPDDFGIEGYDQDRVNTFRDKLLSGSSAYFETSIIKKMGEPDRTNCQKMIQFDLVSHGYDISYSGMNQQENPLGIDGKIGKRTIRAMNDRLQELYFSCENDVLRRENISEHFTYSDVELRSEVLGLPLKEVLSSVIDSDVLEDRLDDDASKLFLDMREIYDGFPSFMTISLSDVRGLMWYESYLDQGAISNTGSTGVMQLTAIAFADFKKNPHLYDKNYLLNIFEENGLDYTNIRDNMYLKGGSWKFGGGNSERRKVFGNRNINIALGMSYLQACEKRGIPEYVYKTIEAKGDTIQSSSIKTLKRRGIKVNENNMRMLYNKLKVDPYLQRKYATFVRYNGEKDYGDGNSVQDRFVYAMSVLYMGEYIF